MGNFYGINGLELISHGEWCDPEIEYRGYRINYYAIEDPLWQVYNEVQTGLGEPITDEGFEKWVPTQVEEVMELIRMEIESKARKTLQTYVTLIEGHMALVKKELNSPDRMDLITLDDEVGEINELAAHFGREVFDLCMTVLEKDDY